MTSIWKKTLFRLSILSFILFSITTFLIYLESFKELDLSLMVSIQNQTPKSLDKFFSYFSYFGNADLTLGLAMILALINFFKHLYKTALAWLLVFPATVIEVFQKLFFYHPSPSIEFLRTIKTTDLPSIHLPMQFSFPSGHSLRAVFFLILFLFLILISKLNLKLKIFFSLIILTILSIMLYSRISLGEHWFSDVIGGTLLGLFFATLSAKLILSQKNKK